MNQRYENHDRFHQEFPACGQPQRAVHSGGNATASATKYGLKIRGNLYGWSGSVLNITSKDIETAINCFYQFFAYSCICTI